ncbi:MAG: hypothetical protein AVDCRST_MAG85-1502, partial [uncultured Solirubrobacteraceae bacterium]
GSTTTRGDGSWDLARLRARQQPRDDLPGTRRPDRVPDTARSRLRMVPLAVPLVLPDAEPRPPAHRDHRTEPRHRDARASRPLRTSVQQGPRTLRARLPGPLRQQAHQGRHAPLDRGALRRAQSGESSPMSSARGLALEQPPGCRQRRAASVSRCGTALRALRHRRRRPAGSLRAVRPGRHHFTRPSWSARIARTERFWFCGRSSIAKAPNSARKCAL